MGFLGPGVYNRLALRQEKGLCSSRPGHQWFPTTPPDKLQTHGPLGLMGCLMTDGVHVLKNISLIDTGLVELWCWNVCSPRSHSPAACPFEAAFERGVTNVPDE